MSNDTDMASATGPAGVAVDLLAVVMFLLIVQFVAWLIGADWIEVAVLLLFWRSLRGARGMRRRAQEARS